MKGKEFFKEGFGQYLKAVMLEKGITRYNLVEETEYCYTQICNILSEKGSYKGVYKVAKALKVNMNKLLKDRPILGE